MVTIRLDALQDERGIRLDALEPDTIRLDEIKRPDPFREIDTLGERVDFAKGLAKDTLEAFSKVTGIGQRGLSAIPGIGLSKLMKESAGRIGKVLSRKADVAHDFYQEKIQEISEGVGTTEVPLIGEPLTFLNELAFGENILKIPDFELTKDIAQRAIKGMVGGFEAKPLEGEIVDVSAGNLAEWIQPENLIKIYGIGKAMELAVKVFPVIGIPMKKIPGYLRDLRKAAKKQGVPQFKDPVAERIAKERAGEAGIFKDAREKAISPRRQKIVELLVNRAKLDTGIERRSAVTLLRRFASESGQARFPVPGPEEMAQLHALAKKTGKSLIEIAKELKLPEAFIAKLSEAPKVEAVFDKNESEIEDLEGNKPVINKDGTISVFHATSPENAKKIMKDGFKSVLRGDREVFFSTKPIGGEGFGDSVIEVQIDPSKLSMDDAFRDGEIHFSADFKDIQKENIKGISTIEEAKSKFIEIFNKAQKAPKVEEGITPEEPLLLTDPPKARKARTRQEAEVIIKNTPIEALDPSLPTPHKFDPSFVDAIERNPESVDGFVAMRTMRDGSKRPAVRRDSGIFAPKEFETFGFRDISGLLGGKSLNLRDASLSFDNVTPQQAALDGWGPMTKLSYLADESVAESISFAREKGDLIRRLADEANVKINEKTGEQLFHALEGMTKDIPKEIVDLSKKIREDLNEVREMANVIRRSLNKKEIGFIKNYAPHIQKIHFWRNMLSDPRTEITDNFDYIIPNEKKNPHALPRKGQWERPEINAWKLLESYYGAIANDMFTSPMIEQLKAANSVLKGRKYFKMGGFIEKHIRESMVGKPAGIDSNLGIIEGTKKRMILQRVNKARNTASLAGNLVWNVFVQPASHVLTLARGGGIKRGLQNLLGGIVDFATDNSIKAKVRKLPTIITKTRGASIGETGAGDLDRIGSRIMRSKLDTWNDTLAKLADSIEFWLTGTASAAGYREAAKLGLRGRDADIFADWLGGATQSRYNKEARPIIMNNIFLRSMSPFQTYAFELYRFAKTLVGSSGGMPLEKKSRFSQAIMLLAGMYIYNKYSEATTGRTLNTIGSFVPLVGGLVDKTVSKAKQAVGLEKTTIFGSGRAPIAPEQDITNFLAAVSAFINKNNIQPLRKEMIKWGFGFGGIGGATTVNRFVDGMIAVTDGYQKTKSGKRAFDVVGFDAFLAPAIGPYSTRAGKVYLQRFKGEKKKEGFGFIGGEKPRDKKSKGFGFID